MKIHKPRHLRYKMGPRGRYTTTVADILPYLPPPICFFDCRHFVADRDVVPFALSTRSAENNQQYLYIITDE